MVWTMFYWKVLSPIIYKEDTLSYDICQHYEKPGLKVFTMVLLSFSKTMHSELNENGFKKKSFILLSWQPSFSNLNPIEPFWDVVGWHINWTSFFACNLNYQRLQEIAISQYLNMRHIICKFVLWHFGSLSFYLFFGIELHVSEPSLQVILDRSPVA